MGKKRKRMQPGNFFPEIVVYACTTVKEARRLARKHFGSEFEEPQHEAFAHILLRGSDIGAVVLVKGFDNSAQSIALLAHECSHVVGTFLENIGEDSNDSEFRAYETQAVMLACLDQLGYGKRDS